jgi:hypothetical protein
MRFKGMFGTKEKVEAPVPKPPRKPKREYRYYVDGYTMTVYDQDDETLIKGLVNKEGLEKIKRDFKEKLEEDIIEIAVDKDDSGDPLLIRRKDIKVILYEEETEYISKDERKEWEAKGYTVKRELR